MKSGSFLALLAFVAFAQEDKFRGLWNTEFINKRPPAATPAQPTAKPAYKPATPAKPAAAPVGSGTMLGITLWRFSDQPGTRLLVIPRPGEKKAGTLQRVDVAAPITKTD